MIRQKNRPEMSSRAGIILAVAGMAALAITLALGIAGFDGTDHAGLTVTRACGSVAFVGIILYLGYRPRLAVTPFRAAAVIIPALAVAVNNLPIIPLITGEAVITGNARDMALFAVECLFIGLFEESAFRGVLLLTVTERYGGTRRGLFLSALVTSAVFGASHLFNLLGGAGVGATLLQVSYSFLIGGMCSLVLLLTGSLSACVVIHAVYDFSGYLVPRLGEGRIWTPAEVALTAVVGVAVLAYFLLAARRLDPEAVRKLVPAKKIHKMFIKQ